MLRSRRIRAFDYASTKACRRMLRLTRTTIEIAAAIDTRARLRLSSVPILIWEFCLVIESLLYDLQGVTVTFSVLHFESFQRQTHVNATLQMVTRHYLQVKRYHGNLGSFERKKRTREAFERGGVRVPRRKLHERGEALR